MLADSGGNMLSPELKKLMHDLENGADNIEINAEAMLKELHELYALHVEGVFYNELSGTVKIENGIA